MNEIENGRYLPVLYTIPRWKLTRYKGNKMQYYIPWMDIWISNKYIKKYLIEHGYTIQEYYDRWFLNITVPSERPRCQVCGCEAAFDGFEHKYSKKSCHRIECMKISSRNNKSRVQTFESNFKRSETLKKTNKENPGIVERRSKSLSNTYKNNPDLRLLQANNLLNRINKGEIGYKRGIYSSRKFKIFSTYENKDIILDSTYELRFLNDLIMNNSVVNIIREPFRITYRKSNGLLGKYVPDFLVEYSTGLKILYEVKPEKFIINDYDVISKGVFASKFLKDSDIIFMYICESNIISKQDLSDIVIDYKELYK